MHAQVCMCTNAMLAHALHHVNVRAHERLTRLHPDRTLMNAVAPLRYSPKRTPQARQPTHHPQCPALPCNSTSSACPLLVSAAARSRGFGRCRHPIIGVNATYPGCWAKCAVCSTQHTAYMHHPSYDRRCMRVWLDIARTRLSDALFANRPAGAMHAVGRHGQGWSEHLGREVPRRASRLAAGELYPLGWHMHSNPHFPLRLHC